MGRWSMYGGELILWTGKCLDRALRAPVLLGLVVGDLSHIWLTWRKKMQLFCGTIYVVNGTQKTMSRAEIPAESFFGLTFSCFRQMSYPTWVSHRPVSGWFVHTSAFHRLPMTTVKRRRTNMQQQVMMRARTGKKKTPVSATMLETLVQASRTSCEENNLWVGIVLYHSNYY